jgi:hypothetical protein
MFAWLISHQPAVLFSRNKSATSNQPAVLFSQNKPAPAISHQPTEQAVGSLTISIEEINTAKKLLSILFVSYHISYVLRAIILVKYQPFCNNIFLKHKHHSFF